MNYTTSENEAQTEAKAKAEATAKAEAKSKTQGAQAETTSGWLTPGEEKKERKLKQTARKFLHF